jgi:hypothetical protein
MLAAAFILLIACANLAGLTLVRMLRPHFGSGHAAGAGRLPTGRFKNSSGSKPSCWHSGAERLAVALCLTRTQTAESFK